MKSLLRQLDAAIGSIYSIDTELKAEDFLLPPKDHVPTGALWVHSPKDQESDLELAIVFNPNIQSRFPLIQQTPFSIWNQELTQAFAVAAEEVSHFRFFVFHSEQNRPVSHLEMEFQAELDKFLLFYFLSLTDSKEDNGQFQTLFQRLFEEFSLLQNLAEEEKQRYLLANRLAKEFIHKHRDFFKTPERYADLFQELRGIYRMSSGEKFGLKNRL